MDPWLGIFVSENLVLFLFTKKKKMILVFDVLSLVNSTHYLVKRILRKNEDGIVR